MFVYKLQYEEKAVFTYIPFVINSPIAVQDIMPRRLKLTINFDFFNTQLSVLSLQILVQLEDLVQHHLVVTTHVRIMTVKLHCPAVFNSGLCRTLVNTE